MEETETEASPEAEGAEESEDSGAEALLHAICRARMWAPMMCSGSWVAADQPHSRSKQMPSWVKKQQLDEHPLNLCKLQSQIHQLLHPQFHYHCNNYK
jgi:hypothetical protein